ncbi:MAG: MtrB/PioB family outer membrane beta-barrel protein [Acidobacteria bacterium]|nr:MtrB/PioB family outer membrane beta-barrel protein [Acidobacteriota bacterium]
MRADVLTATVVLLLASGSAASAQTQSPASLATLHPTNPAVFGQIDFGGRFTTVTGDRARYQRYRDLREGVFFDMPFYHRETATWWMNLTVRNAGYRDQRYLLTAARPGRVKFRVLYDLTPTFISDDTRTPYTPRPQDNGSYDNFGGTLSLPDTVQASIEANPLVVRQQIESLAVGFPSRIRRDSLGFDLTFDVNERWQTKVKYLNTRKKGTIPWGASFGFNLPIEIPLPIDTRTDDFGASLAWDNNRGMLRVGYDGSWFDQGIPTYIWDNPLRITDRTYATAYSPGDGTSRGLGTQWPSNSFQYVNFAGAYRLPSRTNVNGTVSIGQASQNQALVPFTINTAIAPLNNVSSLDRRNAETKANLGAATLNVITRPSRSFNINGRYRFARYDNNTPHFERTEYVRFDQVEEPGGSPEFQGYTRNYLDVDAAYTGLRYTAFRAGYGYADADFTQRVYFKSNDNTFRASVDTVGNQYISFRSLYEFSRRRGAGFHAAVLEEAGEQPGMRHFDVADRNRNRVTLVTNVMPMGDIGMNASIAWTKDTFLNPEQSRQNSFGLLNYKSQTYGIGIDYLPGNVLGVGASYNFDKYDGLSQSRNGSPGQQFEDPDRNWTTDEDQRGHSVVTYVELRRLVRNTEVRFGYDHNKYNGTYVYATGPAYSPSPTAPGRVAQLPELASEENRLSTDVRYFIRRDVALGFAYWYDHYTVSDFALGPPGEAFVSGIARPAVFESQALDSPINGVLLNYFYRPYTSHTGWVRLTYLW